MNEIKKEKAFFIGMWSEHPKKGEIPIGANTAEELNKWISLYPLRRIEIFIQQGPIKENGLNGAQVDDLIKISKTILEKLNKALASRETSMAITKLDEAILWLMKRTQDREKRGVEGTSSA